MKESDSSEFRFQMNRMKLTTRARGPGGTARHRTAALPGGCAPPPAARAPLPRPAPLTARGRRQGARQGPGRAQRLEHGVRGRGHEALPEPAREELHGVRAAQRQRAPHEPLRAPQGSRRRRRGRLGRERARRTRHGLARGPSARLGDVISVRGAGSAMAAARGEGPGPQAGKAGKAARGQGRKRRWRPVLLRSVVGSVQEGASGPPGGLRGRRRRPDSLAQP